MRGTAHFFAWLKQNKRVGLAIATCGVLAIATRGVSAIATRIVVAIATHGVPFHA